MPVSIDFDALDRLYIADNAFGSIRVVARWNDQYTEKDNRVFDVAQMRISDHGLTTVYTTHTLGHEVTRVRYHTASNGKISLYLFSTLYYKTRRDIWTRRFHTDDMNLFNRTRAEEKDRSLVD